MINENFFQLLKIELDRRNNPDDLKPSIIADVVQLNPIVVRIKNSKILLKESEQLEISEWFRFRCNIDAEKKLSEIVPQNCDSAKNVTECHSYTGNQCMMPDAVLYVCEAISALKDELLAFKCNLKVNDIVILASLEQEDKYVLLDKVV